MMIAVARLAARATIWSIVALALLHANIANAATTIEDVCAKVPRGASTEGFERLHARFDAFARSEPDRAIELACAEQAIASSSGERLRAAIDLGYALTNASREDDAATVLSTALDDDVANRWDSALRAEAYLRRGNARAQQREMKKAAVDYETAQASMNRLQQRRSAIYAEVLLGRSSVLHEALDLDGAERAVDEADAILVDLGLSKTRAAGDVLNQRTMIAYARQDFPATLRYAEAEIALIRSIGGPDDREQLDALATVGALRSMTGDFAGAEVAQREGLRLTQVRDDAPFDARLGILQNFSTFYLDRLEPAEALPLAEEALALAQKHYEPGAVALFREYVAIGSVHADLLRYADARADFVEAAKIEAAHGDVIAVLSRLRFALRRAQLDLALGDLDEARTGVARAERLMGEAAKLGYWRGWGARLACKIDAVTRDWSAADADCKRAIDFLGEVVDRQHPLILEALIGRCLAQTLGRLSGEACSEVDRRMQSASLLNPKMRMLIYAAIATREQSAGRGDAAFDLRVRVLAVAEEIAAPDPLWAADFAMAESVLERGDRPLAIFFAKRSVAAIEAMRDHLAADRERLERGFLSDKLTVYRHLADWLLAERRAPEAIAVLRLLKREEMYDFGERGAANDGQGRVALSPREETLARQLDALRVAASTKSPAGASSSIVQTAAEIERLTKLRDARKISADELQRLQLLETAASYREEMRAAGVRRFIAEQKSTTAPQARARSSPVDREALRAASLKTDEGDVYYFMSEDHLNLVFAWRGGIARTVVDVDPARLARAIGDELSALASSRDPHAPDSRADGRTSELHALLGAPIDREATRHGITRINLWLDGLLRYVPFAALADGRGYLIERYEFVYRFGDGVDRGGVGVTSGPARAAPQLAAFGVTRAVGGLPALPGVGDELCGIVKGPVSGLDEGATCAVDGLGRGTLPGSGYANEWFTESRLQGATSNGPRNTLRPAMLHLGTHFSLRPGNIQRSWLMLGDGVHLPLANFAALDFGGIDLVTLSACETAMAGAVGDDGREIEGLPALVHRRGAQSVVASLWRVDDRSASDLMRDFYAALGRGEPRASGALRRAQLAMLRGADEAHRRPYYWAAFVTSTVTQ
jgi:CHAT domain-containing protein